MMVPPRLQCLNASRMIAQKTSSLRASFSTSSIALADDRSGSSSNASADLLSSLAEPTEFSPRRSAPINLTPRNPTPSRLEFAPRSSHVGTPSATASVSRLIANAQARRLNFPPAARPNPSTVDEVKKHKLGVDLSRQIYRRWKAGDVYTPHDLTPTEMKKWKVKGRPRYDAFDVLDFNPVDEYRNFSIMSEYMTPMGRIKHNKVTGLRPVNQRKIARAIRRSIGMGLMPSVYRHPEILQKIAVRTEQNSPNRRGPI